MVQADVGQTGEERRGPVTFPTMQEVRELHELNVELMDTLLLIGQQLIEHADKHGITIEHRDALASLVGRAQRILASIGNPYRRNPIVRDVTKSRQNQESLRKMEH